MVTWVLLNVAKMFAMPVEMFFCVLGLDDLLRVRIFTEQIGGGRHGNRDRFSGRSRNFGGGRGFFLGRLRFRRGGVGGSNRLHFFFLLRRGWFFLFFGHIKI